MNIAQPVRKEKNRATELKDYSIVLGQARSNATVFVFGISFASSRSRDLGVMGDYKARKANYR